MKVGKIKEIHIYGTVIWPNETVIWVELLCLAVNRLCYNLTVTMKNWIKNVAGKA